jgi:hypothetical protein
VDKKGEPYPLFSGPANLCEYGMLLCIQRNPEKPRGIRGK